MAESSTTNSGWRRLIEGHVPLLATAAMFSFVVLKVLGVANGEPETALAIVSSAGVAQIAIGVIVASYGLFVLMLVYWAVYWGVTAACREASNAAATNDTEPTDTTKPGRWACARRPSIRPPIVVVAVAAVALAALDSVLLGVGALVLSVVVIVGGSCFLTARNERWRTSARVVFFIVGVVGFVAFAGLGGLWLPTEIITTHENASDTPTQLEGYVLSESADWMSVLSEAERVVLRVELDSVTARKVCTKSRGEVFGRSIVEIVGHDSTPAPLCSDLLASSD